MEIKCLLFAQAKEIIGRDSITIIHENPQISSTQLSLLIEQLYPQLSPIIKTSILAVNMEYAFQDTLIHPQDEVALIPPISGG